MKRRIVIDGRMIEKAGMHGIARYAYNLLLSLDKVSSEHAIYVLTSQNSPLFDLELNSNIHLVPTHSKWIGIREQFELPKILGKINADLFHTPSYVAPFFTNSKMIMTIHDMNHLVLPQYYTPLHQLYYRFVVRAGIKKSSFVITVSDFSKKEIIRTLKLNPKKIFVTHNGVSKHFMRIEDELYNEYVREIYGLPEQYIFCLSNNKPHKNLISLVKAFGQSNLNVPLVIASPVLEEALQVAEAFGKKHLIHFTRFIREKHLASVYSQAEMFVYPSTYEGFGLPALEALACGVPVVVSRLSSLPEVVGSNAVFTDVTNPDIFSHTLEDSFSNQNIRKNAALNGPPHARNFSWKSMAEKTLKIYEMACYDQEAET